jgi:Leucine-rich repeat (LRR) protein
MIDLNSLPEDIEEIDVSNKRLTSLDVTRFKKLKILHCQYNKLSSLHLNENLEELYCHNNQLTSLHLNENLESLYCSNNQLTSLHLNENLEELHCSHNELTSLHLNENLQQLYCNNNPISEIYDPISEIIDHIGIIKKLRVLNQFKYSYFCLKYKKRFRDWLWVKIREPKIRERYSHNYLLENLHEDTDLDDLLENW